MSIARHHAEWLSLLEISGPFVSMPVLVRAFPQGLDAIDASLKATFKQVYEEWQAAHREPRGGRRVTAGVTMSPRAISRGPPWTTRCCSRARSSA